MIFTRQKPLSEIMEILEGFDRVCVVGCPECSTVCMTGGEKQVAEMKANLESAGKQVVGAFVPEYALCNTGALKAFLRKPEIKPAIENADALLTFGCGTGAHSAGLVAGLPAISGNDTQGIAVKAPMNEFRERCAACGKCELGWTAGLCPITMCAKSLLNGPCGGMENGKCEVDPDRECGWVKIYKRLEELGKLENLEEIRIKDYDRQNKPRDWKLDSKGKEK